MKAIVKRPPAFSLKEQHKKFTAKLAENQKGLENAGNKKAYWIRTSGVNYCTQMLSVLDELMKMD